VSELRHLFVHLDSSPICDRRVSLALWLAARHGAHVTAVFAQIDGVVPTYGLPEGLPKTTAHVGAHLVDRFAETARAADVRFDAHVAPLGDAAMVVRQATEGARDSDLAVLGQPDPPEEHGEVPPDLVERVLLHCGRPVMLVPHLGQVETIGRRVLVGWNGTREAARAVNDAIPLMRDAEIVHLLSIAPPKEMDIALDTVSGGLVRHLGRHGIEAHPAREPRHGVPVANVLVSRVTDTGSDLLVLGGFGHYGFPHVLRGGVTRPLISQITVPTLLSH